MQGGLLFPQGLVVFSPLLSDTDVTDATGTAIVLPKLYAQADHVFVIVCDFYLEQSNI